MSAANNGGPAFPHPGGSMDAAVQESYLGMTLRDYFAAKAMVPLVEGNVKGSIHYGNESVMADRAYEIADAMLAARGQP